MLSSKKITCKGTFRQVFICLRPCAPDPPSSPPLTHCICVLCMLYSYSHREGGGGLNQRECYRDNSSLSWVENTNMITLINTCRKVPLQINFVRWRHFVLVSIRLISPRLKVSKVVITIFVSHELFRIVNKDLSVYQLGWELNCDIGVSFHCAYMAV